MATKSLGLASMVGTRVFMADADTAGTTQFESTELPGIEETSGGGIVNGSFDYVPHDTGIKNRVATIQEYNNVRISVADTPLTNGAYGNSVATILNDLAKNRTKFDLIKMTPAKDGQYKVVVWTGILTEATTDDAKAENLQRGDFSMVVSARNEFIGTISAEGVPTLTARTENNQSNT